MAEKVNYIEEDKKNSIVAFLLVEAISAHPDKELQKEIIESGEGGNYDLTLTVNGYELPLRPALEHMAAQFDRKVLEKTEELWAAEIDELDDILYEAKGSLKWFLERVTAK